MTEAGAPAGTGPYKAGDITIDPVLDTPAPQRDVSPWWANHYTFFGTAVGLLFVFLSLTPSLLPRGPLFQGLVSGGAGAIGYLIGVFAVWLVRYMRGKDTSPTAPRWAWLTLLVVGVVGMVVMQFLFHHWQDDVRDLMGVPRLQWFNYPQAAVIGVIVLFVFVEIGQWVRRLVLFLVHQLERVAPPRVSGVVAVGLVVALTIALLNGVVVRATMDFLNHTFAAVNDERPRTPRRPTTPLRSGGPESLVSWSSLGHQGRSSCRAARKSRS